MVKAAPKGITRGQSIAFRIPSDTPDYILQHLDELKQKERRNFSSQIANYVFKGIESSLTDDKETITIPLPKKLNKEQRDWLKHEQSEAILGKIIYQLLADPISVISSVNVNSEPAGKSLNLSEEAASENLQDMDLDDFTLDDFNQNKEENKGEEPQEDDSEELIGNFLADLNK
ncbi:hypothetical protein [Scopulibacillus cellulosilyticus]|uniref:Plasmid segregation centromere-binding protein ParR n=1 Tax=Scopulibacillus cellulosilyticus TaxID=2665665 RepID=A0ABW2PZ59_9BACL